MRPTSPTKSSNDLRRDPRATEQSVIAKERNKLIIRVGRIANGYLITAGASPEQFSYSDRQRVHEHIDRFFDEIERQLDANGSPRR